MGQCSFSRQPDAEQQPAATSGTRKRREQLRKAAAAHMNQPYHASSHDELVLMVSLDTITKIGWEKHLICSQCILQWPGFNGDCYGEHHLVCFYF